MDQNPIGCDLWVSSTSTVIPSYFYDSMTTGADDGTSIYFYLGSSKVLEEAEGISRFISVHLGNLRERI